MENAFVGEDNILLHFLGLVCHLIVGCLPLMYEINSNLFFNFKTNLELMKPRFYLKLLSFAINELDTHLYFYKLHHYQELKLLDVQG